MRFEQKKEIAKEIDNLKKKLDNEFPSRHWNHVNVYLKFWELVDAIYQE